MIGLIKDLHMTVNHAHILFLLRLSDVMDLFMNQLKSDSEHTLRFKVAFLTLLAIFYTLSCLAYFPVVI